MSITKFPASIDFPTMIIEELPTWAVAFASGDYLQAGAVLPTRDGRRCGNALVLSVNGETANVRTDAGNRMTLNHTELAELFHPPRYISKPEKNPLSTENLADCYQTSRAVGDEKPIKRIQLNEGLGDFINACLASGYSREEIICAMEIHLLGVKEDHYLDMEDETAA